MLIPDFCGNEQALRTILDAKLQPDDLKRVASQYLEKPRLTVFVIPKPEEATK